MKKEWPRIRKTKRNGKEYWEVDARIDGKGPGRKFFEVKAEAAGYATVQKNLRRNEGKKAFDQSELAKHNLTTAEAVKIALELREKQAASVTVAAGLASLVDGMRKSISPKLSENVQKSKRQYCNDTENTLGKLLPLFGSRLMVEITTKELSDFLNAQDLAEASRNRLRAYILKLWNYGEENGWCQAGVAKRIKRFHVPDREVKILHPLYMRQLLAACNPSCLPVVVLAGFCGLRMSEIAGLSWSKIDLDEKIVTIDAEVAKKRRPRRIASIPENAVAWLKPLIGTGPLMPANFRNEFDRVRVKAGFEPSFRDRKDAELQRLLGAARKLRPWDENCLRHSAISYDIALNQSKERTATEKGTSVEKIETNYLQIVRPKLAEQFFGIFP